MGITGDVYGGMSRAGLADNGVRRRGVVVGLAFQVDTIGWSFRGRPGDRSDYGFHPLLDGEMYQGVLCLIVSLRPCVSCCIMC
jgi:hypothetical protein